MKIKQTRNFLLQKRGQQEQTEFGFEKIENLLYTKLEIDRLQVKIHRPTQLRSSR